MTGFPVAASDAVQEDTLLVVTIDDTPLALTRLDGRVLAFDARCPHAGGNLGAGDYARGRLICPDHGWKFDLRTGRVRFPPDEHKPLATYECHEKGGSVYVRKPA